MKPTARDMFKCLILVEKCSFSSIKYKQNKNTLVWVILSREENTSNIAYFSTKYFS